MDAGNDPGALEERGMADFTVKAGSCLDWVPVQDGSHREEEGRRDTFLECFLCPRTYGIPGMCRGGQVLSLALLQFPRAGRHLL